MTEKKAVSSVAKKWVDALNRSFRADPLDAACPYCASEVIVEDHWVDSERFERRLICNVCAQSVAANCTSKSTRVLPPKE